LMFDDDVEKIKTKNDFNMYFTKMLAEENKKVILIDVLVDGTKLKF
jgi:hypothetical protein